MFYQYGKLTTQDNRPDLNDPQNEDLLNMIKDQIENVSTSIHF